MILEYIRMPSKLKHREYVIVFGKTDQVARQLLCRRGKSRSSPNDANGESMTEHQICFKVYIFTRHKGNETIRNQPVDFSKYERMYREQLL